MGHKDATNGEPGLVVEMTTPLTPWWGTKMPQMVSQALLLKWPHHLHTDGAHRGHNGEPGLVVEMTTPLTCWWGRKRPQMVSQALWLKWQHHLLPDEVQRGHKWWARPCGWNVHTTYSLIGAQRGHKWWARPCGWNDHTTYILMGHNEATNGESALMNQMNI